MKGNPVRAAQDTGRKDRLSLHSINEPAMKKEKMRSILLEPKIGEELR
jgi:hypothetical protein